MAKRWKNRDYLIAILEGLRCMLQSMEQLRAAVARNTDVAAGVVAMIHGLTEQLRNAGGDPTAIQQLTAEIDAAADSMAAAVLANTGAEGPTPEPEPDEAA